MQSVAFVLHCVASVLHGRRGQRSEVRGRRSDDRTADTGTRRRGDAGSDEHPIHSSGIRHSGLSAVARACGNKVGHFGTFWDIGRRIGPANVVPVLCGCQRATSECKMTNGKCQMQRAGMRKKHVSLYTRGDLEAAKNGSLGITGT